MPSVLHISLLGDFALACGEEPITQVDTARSQELLAYLVLHAHAPQQRRHLAFRFWPDSTEKQASTNLRQLLHNLRRTLPRADQFIVVGPRTLQWRPDAPFTLDVAGFEQALERAERAEGRGDPDRRRHTLETAVRLYAGDLLPGCYAEWVEPARERLRQRYIAALDRLVRLLEQQRAYQEAIVHAERLLQEDPLRETTHRTLMRLHALRGDRASALRVYHRCAAVLDQELGVTPDATTRQLHERLLHVETAAEEQSEPISAGSAATLPLVGRHSEWHQLGAAWTTATREQPHLALIAGEAGAGKSRLAEELVIWIARQGGTAARTRCYGAEGRLAFAPVTEWLRAEPFRAGVRRLDAVWRAEAARILPELLAEAPDLPRPEPLTAGWQRRRLFEALARAILTVPSPMVLLIDDLQWCDPDTLEWLHFLLRFDQRAEVLLLGTVRMEEAGPAHPLEALLRDLRRTGRTTEIVLGPLDPAATTSLAEHVAGRALAGDQAARLHRATEGNPLFVVESVRAGLPAGAETLPPKVHAILTARLGQCSPHARELAHLAAVVGRAFTFDVLAEASDRDEETLMRALDELWQRRIVRESGSGMYDFSHDKLREVAYAEVSPVRRRRLHRDVAEAFEALHPAALDAVSGQLAAHYERAGLPDRALPYHARAARVALRVYANEEAITHLNRALALLDEGAASPRRDASELPLLVLLGASVAAARGFGASDTGRAYARARALCGPDDDPRLRFAAYWGSYSFELVRAELRKAHAFSEQCRAVAEEAEDPALLAAAHFALGVSTGHLGRLTSARAHLEHAFGLYDPERHHEQRASLIGMDPGVFSLAYLAHTLWLLGYPDQALRHGRHALALAEELAHPFSRVIALSYLAMLHQLRGESEAVSTYADTTLALAAELGFPYYAAWGAIMKGWALHRQGARREGEALVVQGLHDFRAIGTGLREPYYLAMIAEICLDGTHLTEGHARVSEALAIVDATGERWQEAELYRLRGEMLLADQPEQAEACFRRALEVAREGETRSLELRAATSLSRLWQRQRRADEARTLLETVRGRFTEGFDTPDLQDAQAVLTGLA